MPTVLKPNIELAIPSEITGITVGVYVKEHTDCSSLIAAYYDFAGNQIGNVDIVTNSDKHNTIVWLDKSKREIPADDDEQIMVSLKYCPYNYILFHPIVTEGLVTTVDKLTLRAYSTDKKKILFYCILDTRRFNIQSVPVGFAIYKGSGTRWKVKGLMGDMNDDKIKALALPKRLKQLKVIVIRGRDLIACDLNGKSDPYILVTLNKVKKKTKVIKKTLKPEWHETLTFQLPENPADADLLIEVWDQNLFNKSSFMGCVAFKLREIKDCKNEWFVLSGQRKNQSEKHVTGEIQLGFQFE